MLEFMKFLSFIKKKAVANYIKMLITLLVSFILLLAIGIVVDNFVPWNYFANTMRCIIAICGAVILFLIIFVISFKMRYNKNKEILNPLDKKEKIKSYFSDLSYRQRANLSVIIVVISIIIFLLLARIHTSGYTVTATFLFTSWLGLFYFVKPKFNEVDKESKGLSDERDIEKDIDIYKKELKKKVDKK